MRSVEDELAVGQTIEVMCLGQDARGHVRLSRKAVLPMPSRAQSGNAYRSATSGFSHRGQSSADASSSGRALSREERLGRTGSSAVEETDESEDEGVEAGQARVGIGQSDSARRFRPSRMPTRSRQS